MLTVRNPHVRAHRAARSSRPTIAVVVVLLLAALVPLAPSPVAATGPIDLGIDTLSAFERDPVTGNLVVAGDDRLLVLDASGGEITEVEGFPGEVTLLFDGTDLWVGTRGSATVARVDTATWEVTGTFDLGAQLQGNVAVVGGGVWAVTRDTWPSDGLTLRRLDPSTGTVEARGAVPGARLTAIPGTDTELLTTTPLTRLDLATDPVTVLDEMPGVGPEAVVLAPTGDRLWGTDGTERAIPGFAPTGVHHGDGNAIALEHAAGADLLLTAAEGDLFVYEVGRPAPTHQFEHGIVRGGLATPDASTVYALTDDDAPDTNVTLEILDLSTTVTGVAPGTVVAGAAAEVTLSGQGLGAVDATVDGVPVDSDVVFPTELRVSLPALTPGDHDVEVSGAFGSVTVTVTAEPAVPGTISGTISWAYPTETGAPLEGAEVTVDGPGLADPAVTTTDADGAYTVSGLPPGNRYVVTAEDPSGTHPRAVRGGIAIGSGAGIDLDLVLGTEDLAASPVADSWDVPPGLRQRLAADPVSGRMALLTSGLAWGDDTLVVLGPDGTPQFEVDHLWGAGGPAIADGAAHLVLTDSGEVIRVDLVTGDADRWDLDRDLEPTVAVASGRAFVTAGDDVLALDLDTGDVVDVTPVDTDAGWVTANIAGLPDRVTLRQVTQGTTVVFDATTTPLVALDAYPDPALAPRFADVPTDRAWTENGTELVLSTGEPTGNQYAAACCGYGRSPGRDGTLWFGPGVFAQGDTSPTHDLDLPGSPPRQVALSADADTAVSVAAEGITSIRLAPAVRSVDAPAATTPRDLVVEGSGLRAATAVTVDGEPVGFEAGQGDALVLAVPGLPVGVHDLVVTTPWGTSEVQIASRPTAPLAPTDVTVEPGAGSATVSWTPGDDGGAPIERVVARTTPGDRTCEVVTENSCTIEGLRYGSPMTVTVVAENDRGASPPVTTASFTPEPLPAGYVPIAPVRVLDTRKPTPAPLGPKEARAVPVGLAVPDDAVAVVLNVTAVGPTAETHLTIWPTGATRPNVSSLNLPAGDTRANLVAASLGADGTVSVFNNAGLTNVIVDVVGYHTVDGDELVPTDPTRILDTRQPPESPTPWTERESRAVPVRGLAGVPDDATGVFLNVTAVAPTAATHLTVWPTGDARPLASSLNLGAGQTRPNLVFSGIGDDGSVSVFNNAGLTHVVLDVVGYTVPAAVPEGRTEESAFIGTPPTRVLDSRNGIGFSSPWGPKAERTVLVRGTNGIPADATSVVLNLTAVAPSTATHLTVWPSGGTRPSASNLNVPAGLTAANLVLAQIGADGRIRIRNNEGSVHVVADVVGYHR